MTRSRSQLRQRRSRRRRRTQPWPLAIVALLLVAGGGVVAWVALRRGKATEPSPLAVASKAAAAPASGSNVAAPQEEGSTGAEYEAVEAMIPDEVFDDIPDVPASGPLARFFTAVMALKGGERTEPVRVLWLGDSHTAADFWPDAVRRPLAARYGSGGPGFLFLGLKDYRHSGVKVWRQGAWQVRPPQPATSKPTDDGVFGLGGVRAVADGEDASLHVRLKAGAVEGDANWDLAFRLPNADSGFRIRGEAMRPILATGATHPTGSIQHITWRTVATARIDIDGVQGVVEFFGVVVEGSRPGIVIDTLGINGARAATPLAWDATQWTEQVRRRDPNLVVMAYGTNETGDGAPPERYAPQYEELVARIRRAAPDADCLIAGPTDREGRGVITGRVKLITAVQEQAAEKLGCAFFSTQDAMGGEGGFTYWSEVRGSFTSADGVHLAPRGYAELGAQIVRVLLSPRPGLLALP